MIRVDNDDGAALLIAISMSFLLAALASAAAIASRIETLIASSFRQGHEALYVAEAGIARAIQDLSSTSDWTGALTGATSGFVDGVATDSKRLPGGDVVTLCCDAGSLSAALQLRGNAGMDWGGDTPQWKPYAWGPAARWLPDRNDAGSLFYVIVWVADDPDDGDGNPAIDANGAVVLVSTALGPDGARRSIRAVVQHARREDGTMLPRGVRLISWRESRW